MLKIDGNDVPFYIRRENHMSVFHRGRKITDKERERRKKTMFKKGVIINGVFYESITIAAKKTGIGRCTIGLACRGLLKRKKLDIKYG